MDSSATHEAPRVASPLRRLLYSPVMVDKDVEEAFVRLLRMKVRSRLFRATVVIDGAQSLQLEVALRAQMRASIIACAFGAAQGPSLRNLFPEVVALFEAVRPATAVVNGVQLRRRLVLGTGIPSLGDRVDVEKLKDILLGDTVHLCLSGLSDEEDSLTSGVQFGPEPQVPGGLPSSDQCFMETESNRFGRGVIDAMNAILAELDVANAYDASSQLDLSGEGKFTVLESCVTYVKHYGPGPYVEVYATSPVNTHDVATIAAAGVKGAAEVLADYGRALRYTVGDGSVLQLM